MRLVVQRVKNAEVRIDGKTHSSIKEGLLLLVAFHVSDTLDQAAYLAKKVAKLRIFPDEAGKMNRSVKDTGGEVLSVSQFTLYGDTSDGNRPSFTESMGPKEASELFDGFNGLLEAQLPGKVQTGVFQAEMAVSLVNDGPVTILLERSV